MSKRLGLMYGSLEQHLARPKADCAVVVCPQLPCFYTAQCLYRAPFTVSTQYHMNAYHVMGFTTPTALFILQATKAGGQD